VHPHTSLRHKHAGGARYPERRRVKVTLPASPPDLRPEATRILLRILVELLQHNEESRIRYGEQPS
jgi:hypothetical protein